MPPKAGYLGAAPPIFPGPERGWAAPFDYCALLYYTCAIVLHSVAKPYDVFHSLLTTCG